MKKILLGTILGVAFSGFVACSPDSDDEPQDYQEWRERNVAYVQQKQQEKGSDGQPLFQTIRPSFAPGLYSLVRWHNDRAETADNLSPLDNSTVKVNYKLQDIDGTVYDSGTNKSFQPCNTVVGFWSTLTSMNVGDTVTAIVPYEAGYGNISNGNIQPYTTLIFSIRLKEIIGYEIKH